MKINKALVDFLNSIVRDPDKLDAFNDPQRRNAIVEASNLSPEDKAALLSDNSGDILRRLTVDPDDVAWVIAPGIKKSSVAFGIKGIGIKGLGIKYLGIKGSVPKGRGPATRRKGARAGKKRSGRKKSKG